MSTGGAGGAGKTGGGAGGADGAGGAGGAGGADGTRGASGGFTSGAEDVDATVVAVASGGWDVVGADCEVEGTGVDDEDAWDDGVGSRMAEDRGARVTVEEDEAEDEDELVETLDDSEGAQDKETGEGVLVEGIGIKEGEAKRLDIRVETGAEVRERRGVEVVLEEVLSIESESVEELGEGSRSRIDGSRGGLEDDEADGVFLRNFPVNGSLGGSLDCLGIRLVTKGDREVVNVLNSACGGKGDKEKRAQGLDQRRNARTSETEQGGFPRPREQGKTGTRTKRSLHARIWSGREGKWQGEEDRGASVRAKGGEVEEGGGRKWKVEDGEDEEFREV
ncbi:hypothetical protein EDB92DRAFT_2109141 [Lactarius akahatsu]|uniref:Uncharacterized protein n=1 Tax=Lactarius akahatsu TaxID=416441 RepID=A0AAD4L2C5_9AGAM|nr:hypothetical protein EDB92DRAFT_2109141 [Lactarius akahatsu]